MQHGKEMKAQQLVGLASGCLRDRKNAVILFLPALYSGEKGVLCWTEGLLRAIYSFGFRRRGLSCLLRENHRIIES